MRNMLDKVPHADWLCEECNFKSETTTFLALHKIKKQVSSNSFEAGPAPKRQAVESTMASPTPSTSTLLAALKDNKIKGKSFGNESTSDSSETETLRSLDASKGPPIFTNEVEKQKHGIDMPRKLITKSMSFKGLGRSNVSESKVKMLSPHSAPVQEFKGLKQGRECISLERKNTIKPDYPTHATSKCSSRADKFSSLSDGKLTTPSKHFSEPTTNAVKRQSSTSTFGSVPINGTGSSAEARPNPVSTIELPGPNLARADDGSVIGDNGAKTDVLDSENEKTVENCFSRLRQGVNGGNRCELSTDSSISRTKEGIHKENNLKAAIEAAMQKKQDMFRKNRNLDKSNELSTSNSQGNHAGVAVLNISSDASSEEGVLDGYAALHQANQHISNSCKSSSGGSIKQLKVYPADGGTSVLTVSAIPEEESVWQGGFEIHRNGKFPDMCGGFQAHLSSSAAGKVVEAVKKFPQKIVLDEVPRPCVWPMQFKEIGAQEENVALYFFAKDSESYLRSYKMLVDYLMKHDLALRRHVNKVELLVFPSNHLPDKSHCWNAFFFMWGVFQGRRSLCPDNRSMAEICISNLIAISSPCDDETHLRRPAVKDGTRSHVVSRFDTPTFGSVRSNLQNPGSLSNGDCYNERCPGDRTCLSSHSSSEKPLRGPNYNFSRSSGTESAALNDHNDDQQLAVNKIDRGSHLLKSHESPSYNVQDKQDISSHSCAVSLVSEQAGGLVVGSVERGLDMVNNIDRVKFKSSLNLDLDCVDNKVGEIDPMHKDSSKGDVNICVDNNMEKMQFCGMRNLCEDLGNSTMEAGSVIRSCINGEVRDEARIKGGGDLNSFLRSCNDGNSGWEQGQRSHRHRDERDDRCDDEKSGSSDAKRYLFMDAGGIMPEDEERPNLELALGVEKKQTRSEMAATSSKGEDASACLSLSLAFPLSDKERLAYMK